MEANKGLLIIVALVLAGALGALLVVNKTSVILPLVFGLFLLLVAFLSTSVSLYILVFSMLLSPEFLVGELGGGATASRGITFRFDDILLIVIGLAWLAKQAFFKDGRTFLKTPLTGPILFYIAIAATATFLGMLEGRVKGLTGIFFLLKYYEYVLIYFMVVSSVETTRQAKSLLIASLATCFLVSLFSIAQIPSGERASAPFEGATGEPNTLGGYFVLMLSVVAGLLLAPGSLARRWPLYVLLALGLVGLMATLSRTSFVAALAVVLLLFVILVRRKPVAAPMLLIGILSMFWWAPDAVTDRVLYTFTQPIEQGQIHIGGVRVDTSTSDRIRAWQQGLQYWQSYPIWGTGVTGGPFMDTMYPRVLVEMGTVGLVAFFILIGAVFRMGWSAYRQARDPFQQGLAMGFLLGLAGLLVHAIGANSFIIVRIMEPFWLIAALVARVYVIGQSAQPADAVSVSDHAGGMRRERRTGAPVLLGFGAGRTMKR